MPCASDQLSSPNCQPKAIAMHASNPFRIFRPTLQPGFASRLDLDSLPDTGCRYMEEFTVPDTDPRVDLRGHSSVRISPDAPPHLPPGTVMGAYRACG